jgi:hypothetical protein
LSSALRFIEIPLDLILGVVGGAVVERDEVAVGEFGVDPLDARKIPSYRIHLFENVDSVELEPADFDRLGIASAQRFLEGFLGIDGGDLLFEKVGA